MQSKVLRHAIGTLTALGALAFLALSGPMIASRLQAAAPVATTPRQLEPPSLDPCALPSPERGRAVLVNEAVRYGLADMSFRGTDATTSLDFTVTNRSADTITVHVPTGTPIEPDNPQVQKMITGPNEPITVEPGQTTTHRITSYCTENFKDAPPSDGSVAMMVGKRTPETDKLTALVEATGEARNLITGEPDYGPGPMERANPDRFWASVALWSIYRTTDSIGPKEFAEVMAQQLQRQTTPEKAARTARRIAEETFQKVDLAYDLRDVTASEPLDRGEVRPRGKWCGQDLEEDGTILIGNGGGAVGEAKGCPKWKNICVDIFIIAHPSAGGYEVGVQGLREKLRPDRTFSSTWQRPDKLGPKVFDKAPGLVDIKGKPSAPVINDQVGLLFGRVNRIWKKCCVKFFLRGFYTVDPRKFKNDLPHLRRFAEKNTDSKCLKMFIIRNYRDPRRSKGKGRSQDHPGNTSLIDDAALGPRSRNEWIAAHEFGHALGLGHHHSHTNVMYKKLTLEGLLKVALDSDQCKKLKTLSGWEYTPQGKGAEEKKKPPVRKAEGRKPSGTSVGTKTTKAKTTGQGKIKVKPSKRTLDLRKKLKRYEDLFKKDERWKSEPSIKSGYERTLKELKKSEAADKQRARGS